ncbi:LOW QUALITY PROTEIN: conserved Plasmodium protein, unknown function [Plasmodium relictum]|uniref:VHS domain-containing protein n=1 Tax=Plasmodium relictum TaxID=85471 RepID=A0A1J1HB92_PLARL|nr:LOW QUALITY PROTEIN: conserved Plasmodium protein, unknown function [Plasmodium relictum]CRH02325.1 conserved Plasmodium protein, unknown function [Plasmodium relictum]
MDYRGIRKRKDAKDNEINLQNEDIFIKETTRNTSWSNSFTKIESENKNFNNNSSHINIKPNLRRNYSSESRKSEKKKSGIFNSSNISSLSNNCMKSFNNMLNNINYSMKNTNNNNLSTISNNTFYGNQVRNINYSTNVNNLNNLKNTQDKINLENNRGTNDSSLFNNLDNYSYTKNDKKSERYYNSDKQIMNNDKITDNNNKFNNNSNRGNDEKQCGEVLNSKNLENFLNNKEMLNKNYHITGFGNNSINEINNLRNITNDQTYFTCLDNLLRNHGNIDSNEMIKYNDKNINCLNDIIFLDIYRAYNVLNYMQYKINVIILTIKFIGKKIKRKHVPEEVVISLEFLNFCVRNLGLYFVRFIDESFMKKLGKLLRTTTLKKSLTKNVKSKLSKFLIVPIIHPGVATDPRLHFIKRKILFMMQLWHDSFILHQNVASAIFSEYKSLKEKGVSFPVINKSEKFLVKNAETSPSFSDDNILHELPLNLTQINNIMKSLKDIQKMNHDEERTKCINIVSTFKENIIQCINKLSDYKGNTNVSVTLNSLLYINDQIGVLNRLEEEKKEKEEKEKQQEIEKEKETEHEYEHEKKKKKKKKKRNLELNNINDIIFNKYDPWNNERIDKNNEECKTDKTFFNKSLGNFSNTSDGNPLGSLFNNENVFSFFKDEEKEKNETVNENNFIYDKYSVFNELNFNNDKNYICSKKKEELDIFNKNDDNQENVIRNNLYHIKIENEKQNCEITNNSTMNNQKYNEKISKLDEVNNSDFNINEVNDLNYTNHKYVNNENSKISILRECSNNNVNQLNNFDKDKRDIDLSVTDNDCKKTEKEENNYSLYHSTNKNNFEIENYNVNISKERHCNFEKKISFNNVDEISNNIENNVTGEDDYNSNTKTENKYMNINYVNVETLNIRYIKEKNSNDVSSYNESQNDSFNYLINRENSNGGINKLLHSDNKSKKKIVEKEIYEKEKYARDNFDENNYDYLFETFDFNTINNNCDKVDINKKKNDFLENSNEKRDDIFLSNENEYENNIYFTKEKDNVDLYEQNENNLNNDKFKEKHDEENISMNNIIKKFHSVEKFENKSTVLDAHNMNLQEIEKDFTSLENIDKKNYTFSLEEANNETININENIDPINVDIQNENNSMNISEKNMNKLNSNDNCCCDEQRYNSKNDINISGIQEELNSESVELKRNDDNYNNLENDHIIKDQNSSSEKVDDISNADSNDINFDEIDEITKALDDINDNFENMNIYKFDH